MCYMLYCDGAMYRCVTKKCGHKQQRRGVARLGRRPGRVFIPFSRYFLSHITFFLLCSKVNKTKLSKWVVVVTLWCLPAALATPLYTATGSKETLEAVDYSYSHNYQPAIPWNACIVYILYYTGISRINARIILLMFCIYFFEKTSLLQVYASKRRSVPQVLLLWQTSGFTCTVMKKGDDKK